MAFRVTARTLLHLGAELISSDGVALYELVKNAFDAGSKRVVIDVIRRLKALPDPTLVTLYRKQLSDDDSIPNELREGIVKAVDSSAAGSQKLASDLRGARSVGELRALVSEANQIVVEDSGHGMSLEELDEIYLTIGTRSRLNSVPVGDRPILGEKGLGRLAVMRLGKRVRIVSARSTDTHWNVLEIDWSVFSHASDVLLQDIPISPKKGFKKEVKGESGTRIEISGLNETWTEEELGDIGGEQINRLTDPFIKGKSFPIRLKFNGRSLDPPTFDDEIFKWAHASVTATFKVSGDEASPNVSLVGEVNYRHKKRIQAFSEHLPMLAVTAKARPSILWSLGSWSMQAHWFNRQILRAAGPAGMEAAKYVNDWSGGLMVFRDGFRVYPYGNKDDDWLDLDGKALASAGYKVNRKQIIGKVDISRRGNPRLNDQTNREGLRECPEKEALVHLLKHILEGQLRQFLRAVDDEVNAQLGVNFETLAERAQRQGEVLRANLLLIRKRYPAIEKEMPDTIEALEGAVEKLQRMIDEAETLAEQMELGHERLVHLAGLGLMVEILAHELNRSTSHALEMLSRSKKDTSFDAKRDSLESLEFQLRTLQKRLTTLDPATTSGRQRKETFDIAGLLRQTVSTHDAQFKRHGISCEITTLPRGETFRVTMVKGMLIQIIENLIDNAVYWLKHQKLLQPKFEPHIRIIADARKREVRLTDNGPGISRDLEERVFQPFFTTKPAGEGKGLGLYVAREIASYHGASLVLSDESEIRPTHLNTFVLTLPPAK